MNILVWDTETGGLDAGVHSLLTAYFAIIDSKTFEVKAELNLKLKPNDGKYNLTPKAMEINGIDIDKHDKEAITYAEGNKILVKFLNDNKIKGKRIHYYPMGQNIGFDIDMIQAYILSKEEYKKCGIHYIEMDTAGIAHFLKVIGIFPDHLQLNLGKLVDHLNLPKRNAHEAKDDVLMTIDVFKGLVNMFRDKKDSASSLKTKLILGSIE